MWVCERASHPQLCNDSVIKRDDCHNSEGGYGINIQVEKSKNLSIVKFTECDLNQLF